MYQKLVKRVIDVCMAGLLLSLLSPLLLLIAGLVRLTLGSPILFRQRRPGLSGYPFELVKFRSMTDEVDAQGRTLPDKARETGLGRFLRSTSLDEVPTLINVLKGDMSLVGPRPLLMDYLPLYSDDQMRRHEVLPGVTGWAQINGRRAVPWEERFAMDVWYVDHVSFHLDLKIFFLSVVKVLTRQDVKDESSTFCPRFKG